MLADHVALLLLWLGRWLLLLGHLRAVEALLVHFLVGLIILHVFLSSFVVWLDLVLVNLV